MNKEIFRIGDIVNVDVSLIDDDRPLFIMARVTKVEFDHWSTSTIIEADHIFDTGVKTGSRGRYRSSWVEKAPHGQIAEVMRRRRDRRS